MRNSRKGRFRVWDRSQDAFNGEDLVYNFDALDELIGSAEGDGASGPSSTTEFGGTPSSWLGYGDVIPSSAATKYPGNTNSGYERQSGRRTLYSVVSGLNYNDVPLGTVITWWRPSSAVDVPDGWVPCDGRTIVQDDHSFPIVGPITLPDMRNKFVVGADESVAGVNAISGYGLESGATSAQSQNNNWSGTPAAPGTTGAPGIGYDSGLETSDPRSGSNLSRNISHSHLAGTLEIKDHYHSISHTHTVPRHKHKIAPHSHDFSHVHLTPNHVHDFNYSANFQTSSPTELSGGGSIRVKDVPNAFTGQRFAVPSHVHNINMNGAGSTGGRRYMDTENLGLFSFSYASSLWGYPVDPRAMSSRGYGYQYQAVTSYPTLRKHSGTTLNAHEVRTQTDSYNPGYGSEEIYTGVGFENSYQNGTIQTLGPNGSGVNSGGIVGSSASAVANSKSLNGTTGQESIYVNIRPQYVGMLYLMKVKVSTNII